MFGSTAIQVTIGLVFIYLLYSLLATTINEAIASIIGLRAQVLKRAIKRMLDDDHETPILSDDFYKVPIIKYLGEQRSGGFWEYLNFWRSSLPSYISAENFSKALTDLLIAKGQLEKKPGTGAVAWNDPDWQKMDWVNIDSQKSVLNALKFDSEGPIPESDTKAYMMSLLKNAGNDLGKFRTSLESWFNDTMDRASGWYKRKVQLILFGIGLAIAFGFNVDTVSIVGQLSNDKDARKEMVDMATQYVAANPAPSAADSIAAGSQSAGEHDKSSRLFDTVNNQVKRDIQNANKILGLGGNSFTADHIAGCLITAFAISLGAPFWFDLLNKVMQLRSGGTEPKKGKKAKKDAAAN